MNQRLHTFIDSPVGDLALVASDGVLSGLYMVDQRHRPPTEAFGERDPTPFAKVIDQLEANFAGKRTSFDLQQLGPVAEGQEATSASTRVAVGGRWARFPAGDDVVFGEG